MISGVILAAGQSKRLGRPKQLLDLNGEPVLRHTVRNASESELDQVVLVLGHEAAAIADAVGEWGQSLVVNPDYAQGQSTSLKLGLSAVDPTAEAVLFLLGDQPQVRSELINHLLRSFREGKGRIVMPSYRGTPSNPVLFAREFFPELAAIQGDEGARSLIKAHRAEIAFLNVDVDPPLDIDTEEDYERLLQQWEQPSPGALPRPDA
jgi:molybdenum cofactor cytidylyltransferase